jgi:hypothetical protein
LGHQWLWTLAFGHREDRTPIHGYAPTREAAMAVFREVVAARAIAASTEPLPFPKPHGRPRRD